MKPISIFFSKSSNSMKGNWGIAALATLCMFVLFFVIILGIVLLFGSPKLLMASGSTFSFIWGIIASLALIFAITPLIWSYYAMLLTMVRGGDVSVGQLFNGYNDIGRIGWGYILIALCQGVANLPIHTLVLYVDSFGVRMILTLLSYVIMIGINIYFSQFAYILYDDGDISAYDALGRSVELMKGHKLQYLCLTLILAFIIIIAALPLGIGLLFALPYIATVNAHFYESLTPEDETDEEQPREDYEEIENA